MNINSKNDRSFQRGGMTTNRNRSYFDLSHEVKTTTTMGRITPVLVIETLPNDTMTIISRILCRFAPLYLPIMHRLDLRLNYFYFPKRILWPSSRAYPGWEAFITQTDTLIEPFLYVTTGSPPSPNSLSGYLGLPYMSAAVSGYTLAVAAYLHAGYAMTCDQYYRNPQVQGPIFTELVAGDNSGFYDVDGPCQQALWNRDYFTSALPEPQAGVEILLPMTNPEYDSITPPLTDVGGPFRFRNISNDGTQAGVHNVTSDSGVIEINSVPSYLDVQETAATIQAVRTAFRAQEYMEQLNRSSSRYPDFTYGQFGENPMKGVVGLPVWLGALRGPVIIQEVLSTAETEVTLGSYAGQALSVEQGRSIRYHCEEWGFILGLLDIRPRTSYMSGLPKYFNVRTPLDYPWHQFNNIGDQPILLKEVSLQKEAASANLNDKIFAYIPQYSEWRWQNDITSGLMQTIWTNFHLARMFPTMDVPFNDEFVQCNPRTTDVFQVAEGEDEIFCQIFHTVKATRALPQHAVPQL